MPRRRAVAGCDTARAASCLPPLSYSSPPVGGEVRRGGCTSSLVRPLTQPLPLAGERRKNAETTRCRRVRHGEGRVLSPSTFILLPPGRGRGEERGLHELSGSPPHPTSPPGGGEEEECRDDALSPGATRRGPRLVSLHFHTPPPR